MNANRFKPYRSREGFYEIERGEGRTPAGRLDPALVRTWYRGFHMMWKGPLCWLIYLFVLAALGHEARYHWIVLTERVVGAVGSLLPIVTSIERDLFFMGKPHLVPLLRHVWGALWISQALMLLVQFRCYGRRMLMYHSWQLNEWNWVLSPWWMIVVAFVIVFCSALFGGYFFIDLTAPKAYFYTVKAWVFTMFVQHLALSMSVNPLIFTLFTRFWLLILRQVRPGLTDRWGYENP